MSRQEEEERINYILESLSDEKLRQILDEYRQKTKSDLLLGILYYFNIDIRPDAIGPIIPQFRLNETNEIVLGGIIFQGQLFKITLRIYGDIDSEAQLLITKEGSIAISVKKND